MLCANVLPQEQSSIKVFNRDQWNSVLEFCDTASDDLSTFDEDGACTLLVKWKEQGGEVGTAVVNGSTAVSDWFVLWFVLFVVCCLRLPN